MTSPTSPARRARPIGTRIFFLVGLGMVAPALVLGWVVATGHAELDRRARQGERLLATGAAERVSAALAQGLEAVNAVATAEAWTGDEAGQARLRDAVRRARVHHHALFDDVFAIDGAGQVLASDDADVELDGARLVEASRTLGGPGFIALPGRPDGPPTVFALVPVRGASGQVALVVGARIGHRPAQLERLLTPPDAGWAVELVDATGLRLAAAGLRGGTPPVDAEAVTHALTSGVAAGGVCRTCSGGLGAAWAVAPVGPAHWAVLAWQPLDVAEAFEHRLVAQVGVAAVLLFVLAVLFAWGATVSVTRPLRALTASADLIAKGELGQEVPHLPGDEVGVLGAALESMRLAVREARSRVEGLNAELERRVDERTRQLSSANADLAAREAERTRLLRQVISAQEDERKRLARELHDETCQQLAALSMGMDAAAVNASDASKAVLGHLRTLAADTLAEVHRLILDLRPSVLDDLGLESAIRWSADRTLRQKGVAVRCEFGGLDQRLPWELETAVFRAAQEALNNVARHAKAETALVQLQVRGGRLVLEVEDDGQGFEPASVPPPRDTGRGLGLLGMRERVEVFGGRLAVDSAPGQGTHVTLEVPLPQEVRHG